MIVVSDTNILSSLAAGEALAALGALYHHAQIVIPPAVLQELQAGLAAGKEHLQLVLEAVQQRQVEVVQLSAEEELLTFTYPAELGAGEREAMALAQNRKVQLLTNDGKAIRHSKQRKLRVVSLNDLLRLLWITDVMTIQAVQALIEKMEKVEKLTLTPNQRTLIFAPRKSAT